MSETRSGSWALTHLSPEDVMARWRPGSYDPPWSWADEELDILLRVCLCCGVAGHYQAALEDHVREHGFPGPVQLGDEDRVWDGHHRILAAKRLGLSSLPVEIWVAEDR